MRHGSAKRAQRHPVISMGSAGPAYLPVHRTQGFPAGRIAESIVLSPSVVPTLCDPMDCSPPGSSVHLDSPGKNTGVGCHVLLQGIIPSQGLNPGLPHCRRILYSLSHQGRPRILEWVAISLLQGIFPTWGWNRGLLYCREILYHVSYQGSWQNC